MGWRWAHRGPRGAREESAHGAPSVLSVNLAALRLCSAPPVLTVHVPTTQPHHPSPCGVQQEDDAPKKQAKISRASKSESPVDAGNWKAPKEKKHKPTKEDEKHDKFWAKMTNPFVKTMSSFVGSAPKARLRSALLGHCSIPLCPARHQPPRTVRSPTKAFDNTHYVCAPFAPQVHAKDLRAEKHLEKQGGIWAVEAKEKKLKKKLKLKQKLTLDDVDPSEAKQARFQEPQRHAAALLVQAAAAPFALSRRRSLLSMLGVLFLTVMPDARLRSWRLRLISSRASSAASWGRGPVRGGSQRRQLRLELERPEHFPAVGSLGSALPPPLLRCADARNGVSVHILLPQPPARAPPRSPGPTAPPAARARRQRRPQPPPPR